MKPIKYKIACGPEKGKFGAMIEVNGFLAIEKWGPQFGIHNSTESTKHGDFQCWEITELTTGFRLPLTAPIHDRNQAIEAGLKFLEEKGEAATLDAIARGIKIIKARERAVINQTY